MNEIAVEMTPGEYITAHQPALKRIAQKVAFGFRVDPRDLYQETVEKAIRYAHKYRDDRGLAGFQGWFAQLTRNVAVDGYRRAKARPQMDKFDEEPVVVVRNGYERQLVRDELARVYRLIRREFGRDVALTMYLWVRGWKYYEVAAELGVNQVMIKTRIHRARNYFESLGEVRVRRKRGKAAERYPMKDVLLKDK